jgi:hypothetical protein
MFFITGSKILVYQIIPHYFNNSECVIIFCKCNYNTFQNKQLPAANNFNQFGELFELTQIEKTIIDRMFSTNLLFTSGNR